MFLGAHLSIVDDYIYIKSILEKTNINSIQLLPSSPVRWCFKEINNEKADKLAQIINSSKIKKILFHSVYLINLARSDKQLFHLSKISLLNHLKFAEYLQSLLKDTEIIGVCFHPGSAKDLSEDDSIVRISQGIDWIYNNTTYHKLLLENSAGAGNVIGDKFEELYDIVNNSIFKDKIGFIIDTQHSFASGYDWKNSPNEIIKNIDETLKIKNVKAFHLNDSMSKLGSKIDRHSNLGVGEIGQEAIKEILNSAQLKDIPFILETPAMKENEQIIILEINKLLKYAKQN